MLFPCSIAIQDRVRKGMMSCDSLAQLKSEVHIAACVRAEDRLSNLRHKLNDALGKGKENVSKVA